MENEALADICAKIDKGRHASGGRLGGGTKSTKSGSAITDTQRDPSPWSAMNNIVAQSLLHLTASARFEGSLNIDINEITMNLVPFPKLHYLISSLTPLYALSDLGGSARRLDQMFTGTVLTCHAHCSNGLNQYVHCCRHGCACGLLPDVHVLLSQMSLGYMRCSHGCTCAVATDVCVLFSQMHSRRSTSSRRARPRAARSWRVR